MRRLWIGILVFVGLLVVGLVLAVTRANSLLEDNRERIQTLASEAAGRAVVYERAEIAFAGGLAVEVQGLRVAEDADYGEADFLALDSAFVGVELLPALSRRLEVSGVRLVRPTIRVVQTADGFNFATLGGAGGETPSAPTPPPDPREEESPPLAAAIAAFEIRDGTILFEDRTAEPPLAITIADFETTGLDLSLDGPLAIDFSGLLRPTRGDPAAESPFSGRVEIRDLETTEGSLTLRSPSLKPKAAGIDLRDEAAIAAGEPLERVEDLDVRVDLPADAAASGYPIAVTSGPGQLSGYDFDSLAAKLVYRESELEIDSFELGVAGGRIELAGRVPLGGGARAPFDIETGFRNLDFGRLATLLFDLPPDMLTGEVEGDLALAGEGLEWETLKRTLVGSLKLEVGEGAFENVNVIRDVVSGLVSDPGLGSATAAAIRSAAPESLQGDRTPFEGMKLAASVAEGVVRADQLEVVAPDFVLSGTPAVGLDGTLSGQGRVRFSREFSKALLEKASPVKLLVKEGLVLEVPLNLSGTLEAPRFSPEVGALTATARANTTKRVRERAGSELSDALFGKRRAPAEGEEPSEEDQQREQDRREAEDLIQKGLGRLLGE